mmetsp:Transcript_81427/g.264376  ORF Transcript_81427/g.264376 Transcript_81427/m.264376 type:complete len:311 (-) Transcript_81427:130-1062(-)
MRRVGHRQSLRLAAVGLPQPLRVRGRHEYVLLTVQEERGHEAVANVRLRGDVADVEAGLLLDHEPYDLQHGSDQQGRQPNEVEAHLFDQRPEVAERAVGNHAREGWVAGGMHQCGDRAHGIAPQADAREAELVSEVVDHGAEVVSLVVAKRHILATAHARAGKVEAAECDTKWQEHPSKPEAGQPAGAIAMAVHDARPLLLRAQRHGDDGLEDCAGQRDASGVRDVEVPPAGQLIEEPEALGGEVLQELEARVPGARRADDEVPDREDRRCPMRIRVADARQQLLCVLPEGIHACLRGRKGTSRSARKPP